MLGEVRINIQHAAVIMAHQTEAVMGHDLGHAGGLEPRLHLGPTGRIVAQQAGNLVEGDPATMEDGGDFRHRAGPAMGQPFAGHGGAVGHPVESRVVNCRGRLQIEHDHRHAGALHHRQDGRGERVSGDVQKDEVHILPAEAMPGFHSSGRRVNEAQVDNFHPGPGQLVRHDPQITLQTPFQTLELRPISLQANAEQAGAQGTAGRISSFVDASSFAKATEDRTEGRADGGFLRAHGHGLAVVHPSCLILQLHPAAQWDRAFIQLM